MISVAPLRLGHTEGSCQHCHEPAALILQVESKSSSWNTRLCEVCAYITQRVLTKALTQVKQ